MRQDLGYKKDTIVGWLHHPLFADTEPKIDNLPLFSRGAYRIDLSRSHWSNWAMCKEGIFANRFQAWIDLSWVDVGGLCDLRMFCEDGQGLTLGTDAWSTCQKDSSPFNIACPSGSRINGFSNCIPNWGTEWEGDFTAWKDCNYDPYGGYNPHCDRERYSYDVVGQTGIAFACDPDELVYRKADRNDELKSGEQCDYGPTQYCSEGFAVCGFIIRTQMYNGRRMLYDDYGINDVVLKCCNVNNWNDQEVIFIDKHMRKTNEFNDHKHGQKDFEYFKYIVIIGVIAFILINNVFIGCWCLKRKSPIIEYEKCDNSDEI